MVRLDGIIPCSDQYLIYCNLMDRWTPFLREILECRKGQDANSLHFWHLYRCTQRKHIQEDIISQRDRHKSNNAANKYNFSHSHRSWVLVFISNPSWATAEGRRGLKSLRPFVWLSHSISVSIHPFPSFSTPVSSVHPSLHHPPCTSSPGYSWRGHCLFPCILHSLALTFTFHFQTIDHPMKPATISQPL